MEPFTELEVLCQHHRFALTVIALVESRNAFVPNAYLHHLVANQYLLTHLVVQYDMIVVLKGPI